ncbi:MAG: radical SAM protein [Deltaproteobacteria bacterium]|nr:radical SAM protein [Deltaproteobacteria bacterium]
MSLMSNQVTRGQQYYTVQMSSRTFAFDLFGANLDAEVAVLDFPSEAQLDAAVRATRWDRIGLSGIMANFEKLLRTYEIVRKACPDVPIDLGGHIVNDDDVTLQLIERMRQLHPSETFNLWQSPGRLSSRGIEGPGVTLIGRDGLDYYARLPGVGLKSADTLRAPLVETTYDKRCLGLDVPSLSAGLIIPDVGCPKKCDFCTTSHKFGGKFVPFLQSAEDILAVADAHAARGVDEMFVMSENFSVDTARARKLLSLMEAQHKPYRYSVFSSADTLVKLGVETIVKLGYCFVWIGLEESTGRTYKKLHGLDVQSLVTDLQAHGVEVLGSTILGFEHQTPQDLDREVDHALSFGCTYNQFMLYMAMPGTALWERMKQSGQLKEGFPWPDIHGQATQNWHHPHITDVEMERSLDQAFARDYLELGPSLYRMIRTQFDGYRNTASWNHELVQMRRTATRKRMMIHIPVLTAMARDLGHMNHPVTQKVQQLRSELIEACGWKGRVSSLALSPYIYGKLLLEKRRFFKALRDRKAIEPRCLLTHYGRFDHAYPSVIPTPGPTPSSVAIQRPMPHVIQAAPEASRPTPSRASQPRRSLEVASQPAV